MTQKWLGRFGVAMVFLGLLLCAGLVLADSEFLASHFMGTDANPGYTGGGTTIDGDGLTTADDIFLDDASELVIGTDDDIRWLYDEAGDDRGEFTDGTNLLAYLTDNGTDGLFGATNEMQVGIDVTQRGTQKVFGHNSSTGGRIQIHTGSTNQAAVDYFEFSSTSALLRFFSVTEAPVSTEIARFTPAGAFTIPGLASLDAGIDVNASAFTVDASGNIDTTGTLDADGLASLDGGIDMDGAFTVANTSGNIDTTGTLDVDGEATLDGGITINTDKFTVNETTGATGVGEDLTAVGDVFAVGGAVTAGDTGVERGIVTAWRGGGGNTPGAMLLEALDGTNIYYWAAADGDLRFHTSLPTADTDGMSVHANAAASMGFLDDATPVSITNPGLGSWEEFNGMEAAHSEQLGDKAVVSVGANDTITLSATGAGTYSFSITASADVSSVSDDIAVGISVNNAAPADNARSGKRNVTAGTAGSFGLSGMIVLADNDVLKLEFVNLTHGTRTVDVHAATLFVEHLG